MFLSFEANFCDKEFIYVYLLILKIILMHPEQDNLFLTEY